MSDTVTIVSIVVPGMVSIGGLWFGMIREDRRLHEQRHVEWLKEVGEILDSGGQAITEALIAFDRRKAASGHDATAEAGDVFDERVRAVELIEKRIVIRLGGETAVAVQYQQAAANLTELSTRVFEAKGGDVNTSEVVQLRSGVENAQESFLAAAREFRKDLSIAPHFGRRR